MKTASLVVPLGFTGFIFSLALTTSTGLGQPTHQAEPASGQHINAGPVYKPPISGAPASRVEGIIRGAGDYSGPLLNALVPDHPGLTISPEPAVYWYLSKPVNMPLELTLIDKKASRTLLDIKLPKPDKPGIYHYHLHLSGQFLRPGVPYWWYIALVPDPNQPADDIIAGGIIQRVQPSTAFATRLQHARPHELPYLYAEEGLWYDALAAISVLIDAYPQDKTLRSQRAALLEQIGLMAVAIADRAMLTGR